MADIDYHDFEFVVTDLVEDAPIPNPQAPQAPALALEWYRSSRPRIVTKRYDVRVDDPLPILRQASQGFPRRRQY
jgi:hypothetical protein